MASSSCDSCGLAFLNNVAYFSAFDANGSELWRSDGTSAGTYMVKDIYAGASDGVSGSFSKIVVNGILYFQANDGGAAYGPELWRSDGTSAGTYLVKDIQPGTTAGGITGVIPFNGGVVFYAVKRRFWKGSVYFAVSFGVLYGVAVIVDPLADPVMATLKAVKGICTTSYDPNIRPMITPDHAKARAAVEARVALVDRVPVGVELVRLVEVRTRFDRPLAVVRRLTAPVDHAPISVAPLELERRIGLLRLARLRHRLLNRHRRQDWFVLDELVDAQATDRDRNQQPKGTRLFFKR